jgi:hypothetical protein
MVLVMLENPSQLKQLGSPTPLFIVEEDLESLVRVALEMTNENAQTIPNVPIQAYSIKTVDQQYVGKQ